MNRDIMRKTGKEKEVEDIDAGRCPFCHMEVNYEDFRDELSKKEFNISGLCQKCQDEIFN